MVGNVLQFFYSYRPIVGTITCRTGGLCRVVVAVTVVCTVETCLIIVVGVTARVNSDTAGACRKQTIIMTGKHLTS